MLKKIKFALKMCMIFSIVFLLVGCGNATVKIGWSETSGLSHKSAHYRSFTGTERVRICTVAEQSVSLDYQVTVNKGSLIVVLDDPDGLSYWQNTFNQDAADTLTVETTDKGCYSLQVTGEDTGGSFDLAWHIDG